MNQMPEKLLKLMHEKISIFNVDSATGEMRGMLYAEGFDSCYQHLAPLIQEMREALLSLSNESAALISVHGDAISQDYGNTNIQCTEHRITRARQALEKINQLFEKE